MQKNRIELAGYVAGRADRVRYLPSGTKVANIRLGESYRYKGKDNQQIIHTNWHALTFYDDLADLAVDELTDITGQSAEQATSLIMKARAHWFAGDAAAPA